MKLADKTVTVFSYTVAGGDKVWSAHVLHGCSWYEKTLSAMTAEGMKSGRSVTVRIPADAEGYISPDAYAGIGWTLQDGGVIVPGSVAQTVTDPSALPGACRITGVTDSSHAPHGAHRKAVCQ